MDGRRRVPRRRHAHRQWIDPRGEHRTHRPELLRRPDVLGHEHRAERRRMQPVRAPSSPSTRSSARSPTTAAPTQTQRPLTGSPAIDAYAASGSPAACVTAADQRGVTRPQPTGGRCDLGADEVVAPRSRRSARRELGLDSGRCGHGSVRQHPVDRAAAAARRERARPQASAYKLLGVQASPRTSSRPIKFSAYKFSAYKFSAYKFSAYKFSAYRFSAAESSLTAAGLADPLGSIPLVDVSLDLPGGWSAFLGGDAVRRRAAQHADVRAGRPAARELEHHGRPDRLRHHPARVAAVRRRCSSAATPLRSIPLTAALEPRVTDAQRLAAWCTALTTSTRIPCAALAQRPEPDVAGGQPGRASPIDGAGLEQVLAKDVAAGRSRDVRGALVERLRADRRRRSARSR